MYSDATGFQKDNQTLLSARSRICGDLALLDEFAQEMERVEGALPRQAPAPDLFAT